MDKEEIKKLTDDQLLGKIIYYTGLTFLLRIDSKEFFDTKDIIYDLRIEQERRNIKKISI